MKRIWVVIEGIEGENFEPPDEWWLEAHVEHPSETCPITGEPCLISESEVDPYGAPDLRGPYSSPAIAERWARLLNHRGMK